MNLVIVSNNYPSKYMPNKGAFVYNLAQELCEDHKVTVIAPIKLWDFARRRTLTNYGPERCQVFRPLYLSVGNRRIGGVNLGRLTFFFQSLMVQLYLFAIARNADLIYTHFLINGVSVLPFARRNKKPLVVASGESTYNHLSFTSKYKLQKLLDYTSCFICVSKRNYEFFEQRYVDTQKLSIIPNAVNYDVFKPLDTNECKKALGFSTDDFVVGFIGHFIHRKGPNRVIEAIKKNNNAAIKFVCVGEGEDLLPNDFTTVIAPVSNIQLPKIMNAFDLFVLPTLNEGHCNVIEEAKACCIPIISSKGTTVEQQVNAKVGVLVDPMNIDEISDAISRLMADTDLRNAMKENLSSLRNSNSIKVRSEKISRVLEKVRNGF